MKLLLLAPYPPYPPRGGGQQRVYQFIRNLARTHDVTLLTFSPSPEATASLEPLRAMCELQTVATPIHTPGKRLRTLLTSTLPDMALRGRSAAFQAALERLLAATPFDVVQAESIEMAQYGAQRPGSPLWVYDAFNAEFMLQRRAFQTDIHQLRKLPLAGYSLIQWQKLRRYEQRLDQRFVGAFAVSAADAALLRRLDPALHLGVVPNGVDTTYFTAGPPAADSARGPALLFTGTLDFRANVDAVTWFAAEVLPRVRQQVADARFVVVGRNPGPAIQALRQQPGVEVVGEVPDVRPWFGAAAAYVVPMRIGGGVRLKLLEALAMGQPVISTSMGAEGVEGLRAGEQALIADSPAAFAAHAVAALRDPALAARLGAAGRRLVVERYDWQAIVPEMVALWEGWRPENRERRTKNQEPRQ